MSTHATRAAGAPDIEHSLWRIDPSRSSIEFAVKHFWGLVTVRGRFSRYHGTLRLSAGPAVDLTVEAASLDTKSRKRDTHLRSPDFFDAEHHPYVRFVSDRALLHGDHLEIRGRLHARGTSIPLDVDATLHRAGDELELAAVALADHRRLGMTWNWLATIRTPSRLVVKARLVRDA